MKRYFILNADDLGMSKTRNEAIHNACQKGFLRSASLCVNGDEYDDAVKNVINKCPLLGVGIHLNIIEGRALIPNSSLTDASGSFKPGFLRLLLKSGDKKFLADMENEFRAQIEKGLKDVKFDHVDSHVHTHGIPAIFNIAAALAKEYGIRGIRTKYEKRYTVPGGEKSLTAFYVNRIKIFLLNIFTAKNKKLIDNFYITNDFLIGVGYTAMMDSQTIEYGLKKLTGQKENTIKKNMIVEALFHPDAEKQNAEYAIPFDTELPEKIKALGFEMTNYSGLLRNS